MSKSSESLHRIDKCTAVMVANMANLTDELQDHKLKEDKWQGRLEAAAKLCPESGHIRVQNGKIDDMNIILKAVKILVTIILVLGVVIGSILGFLTYANSEEKPYIYQERSDRLIVMEQRLLELNHSEGAAFTGAIFKCYNPEDGTPVLSMFLLNRCLKCNACFRYLENIEVHIMTISRGWYKWLGTHRIDIYNKYDIMICQVLENT